MRVPRTFAFVDLSGFTNYTAAYGDDLNRLKGYKHGAVDYIAKPVNVDELIAKRWNAELSQIVQKNFPGGLSQG